jgi:hypothetical protein
LYSSPSIIRMINGDEMWEHYSMVGEKRNAYRLLVWKPGRNRQLGRRRRRLKDNIKMGLGEIELVGVDWISLAQDRDKWRPFVNEVMNLRLP